MEVKLDKRYPIAVDAERAWRVLGDLHALASCMPGAELIEQLSETRYKGRVTVKVGPAVASFGGEVERIEINPDAHRVRLHAKGADKGGSSASMDLTASVEAGEGGTSGDTAGGTSVLVGVANVIVNGKFAQFGGRMMGQVSDIVLAQFAANFASAAAALPAASPSPSASPAPSVPGGAASTTPTTATTPLATPARAKELNALTLLWQLLKRWFAGLFGKRPGTTGS